jgi:hypothetical protein
MSPANAGFASVIGSRQNSATDRELLFVLRASTRLLDEQLLEVSDHAGRGSARVFSNSITKRGSALIERATVAMLLWCVSSYPGHGAVSCTSSARM